MFILFCKRAMLIAIASAFALGAWALPSLAAPKDWERLDSIQVSHRDQVHVVNLRGEGRFDRIAFLARDGDIRCQDIRIVFRNGHTQHIDGRRYAKDNDIKYDLTGDDRRIAEIHFDCRPLGRNRARLVIRGRR